MTDMLDILASHRSIRKYTDRPVSDKLLKCLVTAGRQASTSSNLQAYSIVVVRDPDKKEKMAKLCGGQPWVAACPVFLILCADLYRLDQVCRYRGYALSDREIEMFIVTVVDTALVAQNILVAAESLGLGGCMIGGIRNNPKEIGDMIGLPEKTFPVMGMCLGYPDTDPKYQTGVKPRIPHGTIVFNEVYRKDAFDAHIKAYDREIKATGLYDGDGRKIAAPDGRTVPDAEYSWSEHTARRAAATNPEVLRAHMRKYLLECGFKLG